MQTSTVKPERRACSIYFFSMHVFPQVLLSPFALPVSGAHLCKPSLTLRWRPAHSPENEVHVYVSYFKQFNVHIWVFTCLPSYRYIEIHAESNTLSSLYLTYLNFFPKTFEVATAHDFSICGRNEARFDQLRSDAAPRALTNETFGHSSSNDFSMS